MEMSDIPKTDAPLVAAYQKYTTRTHQSESFSFWFDNGNNEAKYLKYIKEGAPKQINIASSEVKKFDALAAAHNWNGMTPLYVEAKEEVRKMLQPRLKEFLASPEYHGYSAVKKFGNIDKAIKLLGIDSAHAATMKTAIKEYLMATTDAEKKTAMTKMDHLAKHEAIVAALKSAGLA